MENEGGREHKSIHAQLQGYINSVSVVLGLSGKTDTPSLKIALIGHRLAFWFEKFMINNCRHLCFEPIEPKLKTVSTCAKKVIYDVFKSFHHLKHSFGIVCLVSELYLPKTFTVPCNFSFGED